MHEYIVGQPYIPGKRDWPEQCEWNYRGGQHELRLFLRNLSAKDIEDITAGEAEFALYENMAILILMYRFGCALPWSDTPYYWWFISEEERQLPDINFAEGKGAALTVILVEAISGIIRGLRVIGLGNAFSVRLHEAILRQATAPRISHANYDKALDMIYKWFHTTETLLRRAAVRYKAGEGK